MTLFMYAIISAKITRRIMQEHYLIVGIVAVILIVLVSLFIVVINLQKTVIVEKKTPQEIKEEEAQKISHRRTG